MTLFHRSWVAAALLVVAALVTATCLAACQSAGPTEASVTTPPPISTMSWPTAAPADNLEPAATAVPPEPVAIAINLWNAPQTLNPQEVAVLDASANDLVDNLYAGLVSLDPDTGAIQPELALRWELLGDASRWQIILRNDIYWVAVNPDTGEPEIVRPITAYDVVFAVQQACNSEATGAMGYQPGVFLIEGCRDLSSQVGGVGDNIDLGVRAIDYRTVEFNLVTQSMTFLSVLAMPVLRPLPQELLEDAGENWTQPENIWTSGPFVIQPDSLLDSALTLQANPFWPLERSGNVDIIRIAFDTHMDNLVSWPDSLYDLAVVPQDLVSLLPAGDLTYRRLAQPATMFLALSYDTYPLSIAGVRRALGLAVDRETLVDTVLARHAITAIPALSLIPPGTAGTSPYDPSELVYYDPDAARDALARAGFANCRGMPILTLLVDDSTQLANDLAYELVGTWVRTLNCPGQFRIEQQPLFDVLTMLQTPSSEPESPRPGMIFLGWQGDYPDAFHWMGDILGCRERFPESYLNQRRPCGLLDSTLSETLTLLSPAARVLAFDELEDDLFGAYGEFPVIPLYHLARAVVFSPKLEVYPLYGGSLRFDRWRVAQEP